MPYHIVGLTAEEIAREANTTPGAIRRCAAREFSAAAAFPPPHAVRAHGNQRRRRRAFGSGLLALALLAGGGTAYLTSPASSRPRHR